MINYRTYSSFRISALTVFIIISFFLPVNGQAGDTSRSIVEKYGQLRVEGNKIVDKNGKPAVLHGMCLFWSQWMPQFYNYDCIKWLHDDWKCIVIRASMGVESGGYLSNPEAEKNKIKTVVDACIDLGIYVIVDWHDSNAQNHIDQSISFFKEIAGLYGNTPNLIYEIYNEPTPPSTWSGVVKPYADSVVKEIRAIDPDNLIIVGTPTWSQDVDIAANAPLAYNNIAYALHFYAATHKQSLRNKAAVALSKGIALFVSEWGTCESSGTGTLDYTETDKWLKFMNDNNLSWCNWSIADKDETSAALKPGASGKGGWQDSDLSLSGSLVREKLIAFSDSINTGAISGKSLPSKCQLFQNYPNPFNPSTNFKFWISNKVNNRSGSISVTLKIYDILGEEVATVVNENLSPGEYNFPFSISLISTSVKNSFNSGVYFYRLTAGNFNDTKKFVLLK